MASHLLSIADLADQFPAIIGWAIALKNDPDGLDFRPLEGLTIGSIYEKPSTRTRVSFEVGIQQLGGMPLTLLKQDIQLGSSETISDTAKVLSRYLGAITYRCFSHSDATELAASSEVPVINALSDLHHPCQAAADFMTIQEEFSSSKVNLAWVGDGNNVLHDFILGAAILGHNLTWATPPGLEPEESVVERAKSLAEVSGSKLLASNDPVEAVRDSDVIYTDVFLSMGEEKEAGKLSKFDGFQVNEELCSHAKEEHIFLHCLPAHRGEEVTDHVIDGAHSRVFDQAENRLHAQKSILTWLVDEMAWETYSEIAGLI